MFKKNKGALFIVAILLAQMISILPSNVGAQAQPLYVTFGFDDGTKTQVEGANILDKYGYKGTFFVNSSRLNKDGYMTNAELANINSKGHEIASHSKSHLNLTAITDQELYSEIIDDKNNLQNLGYNTTSFAYPFGAYNSKVQSVLKNAGYTSARTVGGVGYGQFRAAEAIPPLNAFATETAPSIKSTTTLNEMQQYVINAEKTGGWLQLVLHKVNTSGETYSIDPQKLSEFCQWLKSRNSATTKVVTTAGAMKQTPTPPPAPTGENQFYNWGLELDNDSNNVPDGWDLIGWGETNSRYTRTNDSYEGNWAEKIEIIHWLSGDRKIVSSQKDLTKAPKFTPGDKFNISANYKSSTPVQFVVYYRDASGRWIWLAESPASLASSTWNHMQWSLPSIPSGATHISAGIQIKKVGYVTVDNLKLIKN